MAIDACGIGAYIVASCENVNSMSKEDIRKSLAKSNISGVSICASGN